MVKYIRLVLPSQWQMGYDLGLEEQNETVSYTVFVQR
jgi:hypothetical protein